MSRLTKSAMRSVTHKAVPAPLLVDDARATKTHLNADTTRRRRALRG